MRAIVGNDIAVAAARAGKTNPWPEGAVIGKIVWKRSQDPLWPAATVPGEIVHVEFMLKDTPKFASPPAPRRNASRATARRRGRTSCSRSPRCCSRTA